MFDLDFSDQNINASNILAAFGIDSSGKKSKKSVKKAKVNNTEQLCLSGTECLSCPNKDTDNKMSGYSGKGRKGILVITSTPFVEEQRSGIWGSGRIGEYLTNTFDSAGIDIEEDCWRANTLKCISDAEGTKIAYPLCINRLISTICELKPKVIVCMDEFALQSILHTEYLAKIQMGQALNRVFPCRKYNCWVLCAYPIKFIMLKEHPSLQSDSRAKRRPSDISVKSVFVSKLVELMGYIDKPLPVPFSVDIGEKAGNILLTSAKDCISYFRAITDKPDLLVAYDYETTGLSPFVEGSEVVTVSFSQAPEIGVCIPIGKNNWSQEDQSKVNECMSKWLASSTQKCLQNYNFECVWSKEKYGQYPNNMVHDILLGSHVLYCSPGSASLAFQTFHNYGVEYKSIVDVKRIKYENLQDVARYNCLDSRYTLAIARIQKDLMIKRDLYKFFTFLTGTQETLGEMTYNGVQVHYGTFCKIYNIVKPKHKEAMAELYDQPCVKKFLATAGKKFNPNSEADKAVVLYDILEVHCSEYTDKGARSVSEPTLTNILPDWSEGSPQYNFISCLLTYTKIETFYKLVNTYESFMMDDHRVHSEYTLDVTGTYRSSSRNPNMQNAPKRKPGIRIFRNCIEVCNEDEILLEVDYSGAELAGIAMISKDPVLTREVIEKVNIHKMWSSKIFKKDFDKVTKEERQTGKNSFVFPSFYGAGFASIAYALGKDMKFVESVQSEFWEHYSKVKEWQNEILEIYKTVGGVRGATGFFRPGPLSTEKLFNTPIQGTTFHLLLDALPRIRSEFIRQGLSAKLKIQVHDSILIKCLLTEAAQVVKLVTDIMCSDRFDFQRGVPLSVEWEQGSNWGSMSEFDYEKVIETGIFSKE